MALLNILSAFILQAGLVLLTVAALGLYLFLQPPREPRHIPSVPFWISLLPLIKDVDQQAIYNKNASLLLDQYMQTPESVAVQESLQRYTIANLAQAMLHVDIGMMHNQTVQISDMQSRIKRQIFNPIFMSFPLLDTLGFGSREKARRDAARFSDHLVDLVLESSSNRSSESQEKNSVGHCLVDAWAQGRITRQQLRDNVTVLFVAGQENPQLALISTLYLLAKDPEIQEQLHTEAIAEQEKQPSEERLRDMVCLTTCIYESLRLLPPIGQLINRLATTPLMLGEGNFIPAGTYLGYNSYATNRDPRIWGADADEFVPSRWGTLTEDVQKCYRRHKSRAEFITFHGGRRACLGEKFAVTQLRVTLFALARHLRWTLDPVWPDRMTPAGPLAPRGLRLVFERRCK